MSSSEILSRAAQLLVVSSAAVIAWILFSLADQWLVQTGRPSSSLPEIKDAVGLADPLVAEGHLLMKPSPCEANTLSVVAVISHAAHRRTRDAQRRAWPAADLAAPDLRAHRIFIVARLPSDSLFSDELHEEQRRYGDLLQGDWDERYHSLLRKHLQALRWLVQHCSQAQMVLKMDDDVAVDVPWMLKEARSSIGSNKSAPLLIGHLIEKSAPQRTKGDKWYLSQKEYSQSNYPRFLSGWAYVASMAAAKMLLDAAALATEPALWIDDVYVTGVLAEAAGVHRLALSRPFASDVALLRCCLRAPALLCDFSASPDGGDPALIEAAARHARRCILAGPRRCATRPPARILERTCIRALPPPDAPRVLAPALASRVQPVQLK